jgi:hypothetical protein
MINANQIRGTIGETLADDVAYLRDNSGSVKKIEGSEEKTGLTAMTEVLDMSTIVDPEKNVVLVSHIQVTNISSSEASFEIRNFGSSVQTGTAKAGETISLSSEMSDLVVSFSRDCRVSYSIKYI